jgi:hypothetical protein
MQVRDLKDPVKLDFIAPTGELWDLFNEIGYSSKWHHYFEIYEELLAPYRDRPIKLLEIGVFKGGSLNMWSRYLHPDSTIVGIDIKDKVEVDFADNVHFRLGHQADANFLNEVIEEFGPFDVIIDDGSHLSIDQAGTFIHLFRNGMGRKGLYVVEDMHAAYWRRYVPNERSFMDACFDLIHLKHSNYLYRPDPTHFMVDAEERMEECEYYEKWVHSIQFFDSIVAFHRKECGQQVVEAGVFDD